MTEQEAKQAYFEGKQLGVDSVLHVLTAYDVPNPEQFVRCTWVKEERDGRILLGSKTTLDRAKLEAFVVNTEAHLARIRKELLSDMRQEVRWEDA